MKPITASVILAGFIGVSVFGFSQIPFSGAHGASHYVCIASAVQNAACPSGANTAASIAFHVNAFKLFSNVNFGSYGFAAAILALLFAFVFAPALRAAFVTPATAALPQTFYGAQLFDAYPPPNLLRLSRWLSLHENSPAVL